MEWFRKKILIKQEHKSMKYSKLGWIGCKSQQNKTNKFLSVYGLIYTILNSCKYKGNALKT